MNTWIIIFGITILLLISIYIGLAIENRFGKYLPFNKKLVLLTEKCENNGNENENFTVCRCK